MSLLVMFAVAIVVAVLAVMLLVPPPPDAPVKEAANEFTFPDNSTGRAIPELLGTARLAPNILWYGGIIPLPIFARS